MWVIKPPTLTASESATACAKGVRDAGLKAKIGTAVEDFAANSSSLQGNVHSQLLHLTSVTSYVVTGLTNEQLKFLYQRQLSRQKSQARYVYDHIKGNALHGLCSYCQFSAASVLDHFIPLTVVYGLSIDPWNLVPACDRCNKILLNKFTTTAQTQMLHPYASPSPVPPGARWLRGRVHRGSYPVVEFYCDPDASVGRGLTRERMINQFEILQLGELYRTVSSRELSGAYRDLAKRFPGGQSISVAAHLRERSDEAFSGDANDRRGAMYEALSTDSWFTTIGYEMMP